MNQKKKSVFALSLIVFVLAAMITAGPVNVRAASGSNRWGIRQVVDKSACRYGEDVILSVYLKNAYSSADAVRVTGISGRLEYDPSLFNIERSDIRPAQSASDVYFIGGSFSIQYPAEIAAVDGSLLFNIVLHTGNENAFGTTSVCLANLTLNSDGGPIEIANAVSSHITFIQMEPEVEEEDFEEPDEEEYDLEEDWETEDTSDSEEASDSEETSDKENSSDKKTESSSSSASASDEKVTAKPNKAPANTNASQASVTSTRKPPFQTGSDGQANLFMVAGGVLMLVSIAMFISKHLTK